VDLLGLEEVLDLVEVLEVQPVPVDDRVTAQDEAHGLEVGEGELVERLEAVGRLGFAQARSVVWAAGDLTGADAVGACRPSESVPTKIPMVTERTAIWPMKAPEQPATAMGASAARYQGVSFIDPPYLTSSARAGSP
jgi:hypothetical protein